MNDVIEPRIQSLIQQVQRAYPDIKITSVRWLDSGQNNDVLVLNDSWIFRFARHHLGAKNLATEVAVLQYLKGLLPLQVPFPDHSYLGDSDYDSSFMGYRKISGVPLSREWATTTHGNDLKTVSVELADFLRILHALPIPQEIAKVIPFHNMNNYWRNVFDRIQRLLFPYMRVAAQQQVRDHFESFLSLSEHADIDVSLIHGDFGGRNILLSEDYSRVVGVIDFGSVGRGDPAIDYAAVSTIHPKMLELMEIYDQDIRHYASRIAFYTGTFALQEALYGAESGDEIALQSGLEQYI